MKGIYRLFIGILFTAVIAFTLINAGVHPIILAGMGIVSLFANAPNGSLAMACADLSKGVQASCTAIKKIGGLDKRIYIGLLDDLASATFAAAGINSVTAITFKADKGLVSYIGRKDKNNAGVEIERGENVNLRNQSVNLLVYYETAEQLGTLDALIDTEGLFAIVETNAGSLEVYGLAKAANFNNFGLVASGSGNSGTVMQDSTAFSLNLAGAHPNMQLLYNPIATLTANIEALDALVIDPAPVV